VGYFRDLDRSNVEIFLVVVIVDVEALFTITKIRVVANFCIF